jgi:SAM-dependent methyltransferase
MKSAVFNNYSQYYDLLYKDKDYEAETAYIVDLIEKYSSGAKTILEFGSGTGIHGSLLAKKGYSVYGIEMSPYMAKRAKTREVESERGCFKSTVGDIRKIKLDRSFDVILSLFHVISYQTTNEDLKSTFENAAYHLKQGGGFIFDVWYGPAVISIKPTVRVKTINAMGIKLTRIAKPVLYEDKNIVDVNYTLFIENVADNSFQKINEKHTIRYFTTPEIMLFLNQYGFELIHSEEWLTGNMPSINTWGVCYLTRKK